MVSIVCFFGVKWTCMPWSSNVFRVIGPIVTTVNFFSLFVACLNRFSKFSFFAVSSKLMAVRELVNVIMSIFPFITAFMRFLILVSFFGFVIV